MSLPKRLDEIAEIVPAIIWLADANGECTYVNRRWSEFTGLTLEAMGVWDSALHPDDEPQTRQIIATAIRDRRNYVVEYRMRRADGAYCWMLDRGVPRYDEAGEFIGYVGTVVEITERKISEEGLRWGENRLRAFSDSVPHIMWAALADGSLQFLNDRVTTITGLVPAGDRITKWLRVLHPDDIPHTVEAWRHAVANESVFEVEHRVMHHTGSYCWYLTRAVPHRDITGSILLWYGTNTDIHRQKEIENAFRDSSERLDAALAASLSGTFRWDIKKDVMEWDDNLYHTFGMIADGSVRTAGDFVRMVFADDREAVAAGIERIVHEGLDYIHEFRVKWPDDATRWITHRSVIYRDRNGAPEYMIGACSDITMRKQAELALQAAKDESERTNAAKDQFLAILSHELRTPLNPVKMVLEMLAVDEHLSTDTRTLVETARRNVDVQARLIDDLLDITRIASGKLSIERVDLRIRDIVQSVIEICGEAIANKQIHVDTRYDAIDDRIVADPARLTQVFWNLVRNATKFTPDRGTITIATSSNAHGVRVDVIDSGIGIDPDRLNHIFELFAQERSGHHEGLGLGLAISRSIVELHGGTISAMSEGPGRGTTITVELPMTGVPSAKARADGGGSTRVMIVEPDRKLRETTAMWLESRGYVVSQTTSAEDALRISSMHRPDVLISELYLPTASGVELLTLLKARQNVHGIAMSNSGDAADVARCLQAGFASFHVKPIDLDRLLSDIASAAGHRIIA